MTIRERTEQWESEYLSPYASLSRDSKGRDIWEPPCDIRPVYQRDRDRILHCKSFRRLKHKTQVFLTPRGDHYRTRLTHTLEVSQNARTIAKALRLNEGLTEAIALGHDLGHTPFGHAGERFLNELTQEKSGRLFRHNIQSVRVLDNIYARDVSMQTLDGILCHNGELEGQHYAPKPLRGLDDYDVKVRSCQCDERAADALVPSTLEGCLVRVCDIVAYLGKDRQDAAKAHVLDGMDVFDRGDMGRENAEIINNLTVSIIEHSYSRDCIEMDDEIFSELQRAKRQNYQYIYRSGKVEQLYSASIRPMMRELYDELYRQAADRDRSSVLWRHHIEHINEQRAHYTDADYSLEDPHQIVTDYIASMTDDYFIALHRYLFPKSPYEIKYKSYFDDL